MRNNGNDTNAHASLPPHKQDALADRVADTIFEGVKKHYQDFRDHEVSKGDSDSIIHKGAQKAGQQIDEFIKESK